MASERSEDPRVGALRADRRGSVVLVLVVAIGLVAAALALLMIGREQAQPYLLGLLALLAVAGVFSLFAGAAGIIGFLTRSNVDEVPTITLDGLADGVIVTDPRGRIEFANQAYKTLAGGGSIETLRSVERLFAGDAETSEAIYRLAQASREQRGLSEDIRLPGTGKDKARWFRIKVRSLKDGDRRTVWKVSDITRERERQENIFQELQQAIDYLDHAPAGFFSAEATGEIVYLNATLAGWLGYDLAELGARELRMADIVSGDGAALLSAHVGPPGDVSVAMLDLDMRTRSGKPVPMRLFHKVAYGADGAPGASRTVVMSREADADAADPLRAAEVRFARFFHNTPLAIATIDKGGHIKLTNAAFARLFGAAAQGDQRSVLSCVSERDRAAFEQAIATAVSGQGEVPSVDATLAADGARSVRLFVLAVQQPDNEETAIVYALDTTEQRALEAQFAQSRKMQAVGQLAGGIAHDFNNVLSAIMMATDFLLNSHKPSDPSFSDIMQIKQNANRAASLVRQLLAFSRRQTLRPQVLDLGEVLSDTSMLLRRLIGEQVKLEVVHGRDLWPVKADLSQFEQVIVNLAVNARDAMPGGGTLSVRTANVPAGEAAAYASKSLPAADYVRIEVTDTGTGIPPEILDKIFEPFFSTKEVGKGTGLGLSTVDGIVKQTGGHLLVNSVMGKGTTFSIFLPRHIPTAEEIAAEAAEKAPLAAAESPAAAAKAAASADLTGEGTVLLVEDEESLRGLNGRGLSSRGYTVLEAANGVEALELFEQHEGEIDLVVSDVVMPEMDGPTLLGELRKLKPGIRVIFVSGYAEDAFEKNLPEGQQFAFLPKPFTLKQLVAAVKETLRG